MSPGEIIAKSRSEKGFSQEELAHQSGVSVRTVQRIEKGIVRPHGHTLKALSKALGLELSQLRLKDEVSNNPMRKLRILNSLGLLAIILPVVHLIIQLAYWNKHKRIEAFDSSARKFISFQVLWVLAVLISIGLIHLGSIFLTGQKVVGHYPLRMSAYLILLIVNVMITLTNSIKIGQKDTTMLNKIPAIF
ncbi:helix-turn-helix domain-containing protein [Ekhidna sp.]|uniref:helix-turn-helix domain-containing protein n=1 Tax=Ekhidna sp. TaxID=2608089 RepID=UPI003CCBC9F0